MAAIECGRANPPKDDKDVSRASTRNRGVVHDHGVRLPAHKWLPPMLILKIPAQRLAQSSLETLLGGIA